MSLSFIIVIQHQTNFFFFVVENYFVLLGVLFMWNLTFI